MAAITLSSGLLWAIALIGTAVYGLACLSHSFAEEDPGAFFAPMMLPAAFWIGYFVSWVGWMR